jgi:hypothetical protein
VGKQCLGYFGASNSRKWSASLLFLFQGKTKHLLFQTFILVVLFLISCKKQSITKLKPTYNKGGYTLSITKSKWFEADISITGNFRDTESKELIKFGWVWDGCSKFLVDSIGSYHLRSTEYEHFRLMANVIGYRSVETEPIKIEKGDAIKIDFYLSQEDGQLSDCIGSIIKK